MNDKTKPGNRIPYESLVAGDAVTSWNLPSVDKKSRKVFNAKREQEKDKKQQGSEIVEDYKGIVKPKPLTAEGLAKLAEEAKKEGFDQGYQEGLVKGTREGTIKGEKAGHSKAYSESKQKLNDEIKRLAHIASNLLAPMQGQEQALEDIVVDMAINFTKELLKQEIHQQPTALLNVVRSALTTLPAGSKNITVYVNEADTQLISAHLPQDQRDWSFQIDNTVTTGGCRVETHESLVDYTCEQRLDAFLKQVRDQGEISEEAVAPVQVFERPEAVSEPSVPTDQTPVETSATDAADAEATSITTSTATTTDAAKETAEQSGVAQTDAEANSEIETDAVNLDSADQPQHNLHDKVEQGGDTASPSLDDHAE